MPRNQDENSLSNIFLKAISRLIAMLIVTGIINFWEFTINPNQHTSYLLPGGNVGILRGANCDGQTKIFHLQTQSETGRSNKKTWVETKIWIDRDGDIISPYQTKLTEKTDFQIEICEAQPQKVGTIWSINSSSKEIHFRLLPGYELQDTGKKFSFLQLVGAALNPSYLLPTVALVVLIFFPYFISSVTYSFYNKYVYSRTENSIHIKALTLTLLGILFFALWPLIVYLLYEGYQLSNFLPTSLVSSEKLYYFVWAIWATATAALGFFEDTIISKLKHKS